MTNEYCVAALTQERIQKTSKNPATQPYLFYFFCALSRIALLNFQRVHILAGSIPLWVKEAMQSQAVLPPLSVPSLSTVSGIDLH